jgi:hypothetical protein
VDAWKRAVDTLPKENLTPTELKQKEQYETGLKTAMLALSKAENSSSIPRGIVVNQASNTFPWQAAAEMAHELEVAGAAMATSSVSLRRRLVDLYSEVFLSILDCNVFVIRLGSSMLPIV